MTTNDTQTADVRRADRIEREARKLAALHFRYNAFSFRTADEFDAGADQREAQAAADPSLAETHADLTTLNLVVLGKGAWREATNEEEIRP